MEIPLDFARLLADATDAAPRYKAAEPFPHIVMDDFLPEDVYRAALAAYPGPDDVEWRMPETYDAQGRVAQALKLGLSDELRMPPDLRDLIYAFNCGAFMRYLARLTGISNLLPDPYLHGGGLHQYLPGAVLKIHADFNRLLDTGLDRRLNLLLYLNAEWDAGWGGALELWDKKMQACRQRIEPKGNRCVIFSTTSDSYHGMPDPLACPPGVTRRSLAMYYYTNGRPAEEVAARHSTLWQSRPGEQ